MMRKLSLLFSILFVLFACHQNNNKQNHNQPGSLTLNTDCHPLQEGFDWAKQQAMAYVYEGDPVGKWFEAALPGRDAFCMRDVSHQAIGALALGLEDHTRNMLYKFAENIAESRDWCSYWEINKYNEPAPVDYRSDEDFWYNLPANFDVVFSCFRIYKWTADAEYIQNPVFLNFYEKSLNEYIRSWDSNGDGWVDSPKENGIRGIPTYWEGSGPRAFTGADLLAAQAAGNMAYARMLFASGKPDEAATYFDREEKIRVDFNLHWWDENRNRFFTSLLEDREMDTTYIPLMQVMPLYFGIAEPPRTDSLLDQLQAEGSVEVDSYYAEVFYEHDRNERAFDFLMAQMHPDRKRKEYPENSFTAIGTITKYLAGINPNAINHTLETKARLPREVNILELQHVPVLNNMITVKHEGLQQTTLLLESGPALDWVAVFDGDHTRALINEVPTIIRKRVNARNKTESFVLVKVKQGEAIAVRVE